MAADPLRNLDLNLLPALDALLEERNVTRAAERLGLSQPAVSAALRRLRRHFGDELLVRIGNRYDLSPLAVQLRAASAGALAGVRRVFEAAPAFDPATTTREFSIIASDYSASVLGDHLATLMARAAPHARLRFAAQTHASVDEAPESLRVVDGMVLPHGFLADLPSTPVYTDSWVLLVSADNDEVGARISLERLAEMPWVLTHHAPTAYTPAARQFSMLGFEPEVQVVTENFLPVPYLVAGTRRVALLQRQLAVRLADAAGVRLLPCPWEVTPLKEAFWWHPIYRSDPAHAWLREMMTEAGRLVEQRFRP
ncbi:LysR family transcriptional regulator [Nocardioides insulae]|uniref:LysR family transcriptional regulator n=1 Tax=Nocardioides insulae TaxID=394734 RepID=UPI000410DFB3|nr:LysR family transcriptional regulator [Nocardioides insulae]